MATAGMRIFVLALLALVAFAPDAHAQRRGGNRGSSQGNNGRSFAPQQSPGFRPGERRSFGPQNDPGFNPGERRSFGPQNDPGFRPGENGSFGNQFSPGFRPAISDSLRPSPQVSGPARIQNFEDPGLRLPNDGGGGAPQQRSLQQDPGFGNRRPEGGFTNNFGNGNNRPPFNPSTPPFNPGSQQGLVGSFPAPQATIPQPQPAQPPASAPAPAPKPPLQLEPNPVQLAVRAASASELRTAGEFCGVQVQKQIFVLDNLLRDEILDPAKLLTEFVEKDVPDPLRAQIFAAIGRDDAKLAEQLFLQATSDPSRAVELAQQVETKIALRKICEAAVANAVSDRELRTFAVSLNGARVAGAKQTRARQTMGELLDYLTIRGAIARAAEQTAKTPSGAASALAPTIICPGLPKGTVVAMGDGVLLVGAGGAGKMEARRTSLAEALGVPLATGGAPNAPAEAPRGILIQCPAQHDVSVHYSLKAKTWEQSYVMAPGQFQVVDEDQVEIDFNKGGAFGRQRYALTRGTHRFEATATGWELRKRPQKIVIDNSRGLQPFHYVLGETKHTVAAGKTATHQSDHPLIARYLRSAAAGAEKKAYLEAGRYQVALSGSDNQWDLFLAE